jgi:hypothetical protein
LSFYPGFTVTATAEIAAVAAALIVERPGYGPASRAVKQLAAAAPKLPDNDQIEDAVKEYITVFCGDTCNR